MPKADRSKFKAWKDEMPGSSHKLIVTGEVECPTTGWTVSMSEAKPPGINPKILILQIDAVKPTGRAGEMITHVPVRFEKAGNNNYDQITIRGAGPDFTIDVEIAH